MEVTMADLRFSTLKGVVYDRELLQSNVTNDKGIPLLFGTSETTWIYGGQLTESYEIHHYTTNLV